VIQKGVISFLGLVAMLLSHTSTGQPCTDDYFTSSIVTPTGKFNTTAAANAQNELLIGGAVLKGGSILRGGWLTRLSAQGSVLWSKDYSFSFYPGSEFTKVIDAGNGNWLAGGFSGLMDTNSAKYGYIIPYIIKIDQYGNKVWSRYMDKFGLPNLQINNLLKLSDGGYIVYMASPYGGALVKLDANGNTVWTNGLYTPYAPRLPDYNSYLYYYFDKQKPVALTLLRNGNLALVRNTAYANPDNPLAKLRTGFELFTINSVNGDTLFRKLYLHNDTLAHPTRPAAEFKAIAELPNGDLSMVSSFAFDALPNVPFNSHAMQIITDAAGNIKQARAYTTPSQGLYCTDATYMPDGSSALLIDDTNIPMLLLLAPNGQVRSGYSYPYHPSLTTNSMASTRNGHYLFCTLLNGVNKQLDLIKTNPDGSTGCVGQPLAFTSIDITAIFSQPQKEEVPIRLDRANGDNFETPPTTAVIRAYSISINNNCRLTCCRDTSMPLIDIDQCNGTAYLLPNNYTVKEPGVYPVVLKGSKGCDSIVPYRISFSQPANIGLGLNQCFEGRDTIVLQTMGGYLHYNWLGTITAQNSYSVTQPGKYWVSVTNACGTYADTVEIFRECEFPIYMPNAFTPNGDFLNDQWGISPFNKNRLIRLVVYNRWGQKLFETSNARQRWDGSYKGLPQEAGVYIYELYMTTLNGKPRKSKGSLLLIR
jgi:gliding motility-associated-like protein